MAKVSQTEAPTTRWGVVASTLVLLTTTHVAAATQHQKRVTTTTTTTTTCEDVHIFLGRGWNEPYPGRQGVLVDAICAGQTSCGYEDILFDDSPSSVYGTAVHEGAVAGVRQATNYAADCPDAQLVLSGYSEGAHVVGDVLAGGGGQWFDSTEDEVTGLASDTTSPGSQIKAALLWGDVRHTAGQSYNVLAGADANGVYPRSGTNLGNLNVFSSVLRSYCLAGDGICAGGDSETDHVSYFEDSLGLVDDAAAWVRARVGISGTATATATATVAADAPATTSGAAVSTVSSASSSSSGGSLTTVTGTADLASSATGGSNQVAASSAAASAASSASTSSPSSSGGVAKTLGGGAGGQGGMMLVAGVALGTTWLLMQVV